MEWSFENRRRNAVTSGATDCAARVPLSTSAMKPASSVMSAGRARAQAVDIAFYQRHRQANAAGQDIRLARPAAETCGPSVGELPRPDAPPHS